MWDLIVLIPYHRLSIFLPVLHQDITISDRKTKLQILAIAQTK